MFFVPPKLSFHMLIQLVYIKFFCWCSYGSAIPFHMQRNLKFCPNDVCTVFTHRDSPHYLLLWLRSFLVYLPLGKRLYIKFATRFSFLSHCSLLSCLLCLFCFGAIPHTDVFGVYSWHAQGPYEMLDIKPESVLCKAITLPTVLSLWSTRFFPLLFIS